MAAEVSRRRLRPSRLFSAVMLAGIVVALGTAAAGGARPAALSGASKTAHVTYKDGIRYTNGRADIRIEITPSLSAMAVFVAAKNRIFQAEGLNPTITVLSNPALSNTLLLAGQYDVNLSSAQAVINTAGGGADVKIVAPGELAATSAADDWTKLWTLKSTGITKISQLQGKKIGFNALGFYTQFMVNRLVEKAGVDLKDVSMVQVPWSTQVAALESGQIQAADMSEPWLSQAKAQLGSQMVIIANPDYSVAGKKTPVPVGVWEVTGDYARAHADILAKLRKVAARTNAYVNAHPAYAKNVIGKNLHLDASVVQKMITPTYAKTFPTAGFKLLGQLALQYGAIKSLPDNSKILCLTSKPCK